jgi:TolB-like protein/Tfp pilus assembly protein PilF
VALPPGTRIGPYEIVAQIGVGGMGEVYRARDTNLKRQVAIKVLPESLGGDPARLHRFQREAEVLASLNHPNIAQIHGLERSHDAIALVMELVEGLTLADRINQGAMPVVEALSIAKQVVEALEAAHESGIVHRDLKPANIKVRSDGTAKVLDFGLAKSDAPTADADAADSQAVTADMTEPGMILGTASYMSPEQARGQAVDKRTDIWAFGCVLYEMLTARRAFGGATLSDVMARVLEREPDWSILPEGLASPVRRLLERCLDKDPRRRLRDIGEARVEIDRVSAARPSLRRRAALLGLAALLVAAVGAGVALWSRSSLAPDGPALPSVAVLPFRSLAGNADDYLGLGIAADVISRVSQIRGLTVRPTTAVQPYADARRSALDVGRELGVDSVLEGTVQRDGSRVRVAVNLIALPGGASLWSERFDVDSASIFEIQDRLSTEIAGRLRISLTPQDSARLTKRFTQSAAAYDLYLQGAQQLDRRVVTIGDRRLDGAISLFEQAIAIDPGYALAHSQLAYAYTWMALFNDPSNPRWIQLGRDSVARALALDAELPQAHIVRHEIAWSRYGAFDIEQAIRELQQAQHYDPTAGLSEIGILYAHLGLEEKAIDALRRAHEIDPTSSSVQRILVEAHILLGRHDEAIALADRFGHGVFGNRLVLALLARRDYAGARRAIQEAPSTDANDAFFLTSRALVAAVTGAPLGPEVDLDLVARSAEGNRAFHHTAYNIACIQALRGQADSAVTWLERTVDAGMPNYPLFAEDRHLDNLRGSPSFLAFMKRLKQRWDRLEQIFRAPATSLPRRPARS